MKNKLKKENLTDREWEEMASELSGETENRQELNNELFSDEDRNVFSQWKELRQMSGEREINVDKAWGNLHARLEKSGTFTEDRPVRIIPFKWSAMRIAAAIILLVSVGSLASYFLTSVSPGRKIVVATGNDEMKKTVTLPDGSKVTLNRNSRLSYRSNLGKRGRSIALAGEAYFEISADPEKPFVIDAGKASVKVLGTTFNVITHNADSAVEVFVKTGKVMLSDNSGISSLILEPGDIGTMNAGRPVKKVNNNPNYLSWQTGVLVYDGQTLEVVFKDLKTIYNMQVVADNPDILNETWKVEIDNLSQDTIIRLICTSFNLGYTKNGDVFHLLKK